MHNQNFLKKSLIRFAFGWNYQVWSYPLRLSKIISGRKFERVLEIGAGKHSMVSLIFDGLAEEIVISYYEEDELMDLENYLLLVRQNYKLKSKYIFKCMDARTAVGNYDVVIMKSVLGGIFRVNTSNIHEINLFITSLIKRCTKKGGMLITIDNGKSFYENFLQRFGARKNYWRFFSAGEICSSDNQLKFGFLTSFSFETRFGKFGHFLDNFIFYYLDLFLFKLWPFNPTVIQSTFHNE